MKQKTSIETRWTPKLGKTFCPVSSFFLSHYHLLRPHEGADGLSSTEAMLIIHLVDYKWDERAPYPTIRTLAQRMGLSVRAVRTALQTLEGLGYVQREPSATGGPNKYHLNGLFQALETLQAREVAAKDAKEQEAMIPAKVPPTWLPSAERAA